ncbi:hypothetical protein, partial [Roseomonas marmotae]
MLGLTPLLTTAAAALDQLALVRMSRDCGTLTPEYLDPMLTLALEGPACATEAAARQQLAHAASQLRVAGAAATSRAILGQPQTERRRMALLALAGAAPWHAGACLPGGTQIWFRRAGDGQVYLLAGAPGAPAAHAAHALRGYAERLWILPEGQPA